jgi:hypothetical protein
MRSAGRAPQFSATKAPSRCRVRVHEGGDALLAGAVGPGDQHRHRRRGDLPGQLQQIGHRVRAEHQAGQVVAPRQRRAPFAPRLAQLRDLVVGLAQLQQVLDGGDELGVIPGLGQVVGRAGLDQGHGRVQPRPGRQQDDGQVGPLGADGTEQRLAFLARGRVGREVHVLDDQAEGPLVQQGQALVRAGGHGGFDVVQGQQQLQRLAHAGVVVDDKDPPHGLAASGGRRLNVVVSGNGMRGG